MSFSIRAVVAAPFFNRAGSGGLFWTSWAVLGASLASKWGSGSVLRAPFGAPVAALLKFAAPFFNRARSGGLFGTSWAVLGASLASKWESGSDLRAPLLASRVGELNGVPFLILQNVRVQNFPNFLQT